MNKIVPVLHKGKMQIDFINKRVIIKDNGKKLVKYSPLATKTYVSTVEKRRDEMKAMDEECLVEFRYGGTD